MRWPKIFNIEHVLSTMTHTPFTETTISANMPFANPLDGLVKLWPKYIWFKLINKLSLVSSQKGFDQHTVRWDLYPTILCIHGTHIGYRSSQRRSHEMVENSFAKSSQYRYTVARYWPIRVFLTRYLYSLQTVHKELTEKTKLEFLQTVANLIGLQGTDPAYVL